MKTCSTVAPVILVPTDPLASAQQTVSPVNVHRERKESFVINVSISPSIHCNVKLFIFTLLINR